MQDDQIKLFLQETQFCNFSNEAIQKISKDYSLRFLDKKELAISLFHFVRDEIKYKVGHWGKKASETLEERAGMCTNSTNLLVALLRASGIPAGYCIITVVGGESFGHILPSMIKNNIHKDSVHIVCYVYLNERWIKCDPSTDRELSEQSRHISRLTELIEWDGQNDAVHPMENNAILNISDPLWNIDYQLQKKPRFIVQKYIFLTGNIFIDFLRKEGHRVQNREALEQKFKHWFRRTHTFYYFKYHLISYLYRRYNKSHLLQRIWKATRK